jgi:hypothetical protein
MPPKKYLGPVPASARVSTTPGETCKLPLLLVLSKPLLMTVGAAAGVTASRMALLTKRPAPATAGSDTVTMPEALVKVDPAAMLRPPAPPRVVKRLLLVRVPPKPAPPTALAWPVVAVRAAGPLRVKPPPRSRAPPSQVKLSQKLSEPPPTMLPAVPAAALLSIVMVTEWGSMEPVTVNVPLMR